MKGAFIFVLLSATLAGQQTPPVRPDPEQQALAEAVREANNSAPDLVLNLEEFLKKYPQTAQRREIERSLAHAAADARDGRRTILYGERVLEWSPGDMFLLDRVAQALLAAGGRENAERVLKYSRAFAEGVNKLPTAGGNDAAHRQDDRDRAIARALLFQSRAQTILGEKEAAERLAAQSYAAYPSEEGAREWGQALENMGRAKEAVKRYADAFMIPDARATDSDRAGDRRRLGDLYQKLHRKGAQKGLGDVILAAFDTTTALIDQRHKRLEALDPNYAATDPMQFHLSGLDGSTLALASLKGNVVVADFWAVWCIPCRTQHPMYDRVMQRFKGRSDVVFLSIDTDETHEQVIPFLDQQKWSHKVYFEDGLQRLLQVNSIPTTILFDKQGHVASRMNGFLPDKFVDMLTHRIKSALEE